MSVTFAEYPPSFSNDNPFKLLRSEPNVSIAYSVEGRAGYIDSRQHKVFDQIFEKHARGWDMIADGVAAELIQLSNLSENVLAELWENALHATYFSTSRTCETQQGYLSKDEFFVLLAELQYKLGLSNDVISNTILNTPVARARRNPFNRQSTLDWKAAPPQSFKRAPPIPPKLSRDNLGTKRLSIHIDVQELDSLAISPSGRGNISESYDEFTRSFGTAALAQPSSKSNKICDFLLPVKAPTENSNIASSRSSDKEVFTGNWVATLPKIDDNESEDAPETPVVSLSSDSGHGEAIDRTYVELEVIPNRTRWDPEDFGRADSCHTTVSGELSESQTPIQHNVTPRAQQEYKPLSTSFSDQLAVQRITSLVPSEGPVSRHSLMRKGSIGIALSLVRKKTIHFRSKPPCPDKAPSGYLYTKLAEALQDAVAEGNISLVASLFKLGAHVNYSSVQNSVHHNILQVAVASGHVDIVDYFVVMGADGASVDNALVTAFFADNIDLAIRLAPHANVYCLCPLETSSPAYQKVSASSLGRVIRDRTMPPTSRLRLLQCLMSLECFDANKTVFQAYDLANNRLFEFSTLATLVAQLDIEAVGLILSSLGTVKRHAIRKTVSDHVHQMGPVCCIRPSHWALSSDIALAMLELLVEHSADPGQIAYWPGSGEMSPLASAVMGGSVEGISRLLALEADPECLVYQLQPSGKEAEAYSALGWAALKGRLDICNLLVDSGATPWRISFKGYTPLYLACRGGSIEVVEYFLSLDVERSKVDDCLVAAVKGDEPRIVDVLLTVGASITPETWISVMIQSRKPRQRANLLSIVDLLLSHDSIILEEPVLAAIDSGNFAGLSRVLERRNGKLDFDKNCCFGNWRWRPERGGRDFRDRTCLYYADQVGKRDFAALLESYGWRYGIAPSNPGRRQVAYYT